MLDEYRERFRPLYEAVAKGHLDSARAHRGHGLDHDVTVAMLAVRIAPDQRTAEKAFCAALLHSTDRLVEKGDKSGEQTHVRFCLSQLPHDSFSLDETNEIVDAVLRHAELNQEDQSLTQQVLMDADRLANLMPAVVMRAGQFQANRPALELEYLDGRINPKSTYNEPASVLDDLRINLREYIPQLRVPEAIELGTSYASDLLGYIASIEKSYRELGLAGIEL